MKPSAKLYDLPPELVVRKPFALGHKKYMVGDKFGWEADGLKDRRVKQMWEQRWVGTPGELQKDKDRWEAKKAAETAAKKSATPTPALPDSANAETQADVETQVDDATEPQVDADVAPRRRRGRPPRPPVTAEELDI